MDPYVTFAHCYAFLTDLSKLVCFAQIIADDGLAGFYRGCTTNLLRTTPAAALTFTSFELIARQLRSKGARQRQEERNQHLAR